MFFTALGVDIRNNFELLKTTFAFLFQHFRETGLELNTRHFASLFHQTGSAKLHRT